jgi:ATP-dependent DNA helicase RecQ
MDSPLLIEKLFSEIELVEPNIDEIELNYPQCKVSIEDETVFELLHILEPGLNISRENYGGHLESEGEWECLNQRCPFAKQILQSQRDFATINRDIGGGRRVDFSFEFPYHHSGSEKKGIIFEYDGSHHKINSYKYYDKYRDDAAEQEGFKTLRQSSDQIETDQSIIRQFNHDIFSIFNRNFGRNIRDFLKEYTLIFIPLAVARIQKTMLEYFITHLELFEKEKIEVAIIERDLPCGAIAIATLQELFENINAILEEQDRLPLPEISLTIFENSKWILDKKLHLQAKRQDEEFFKNNSFDIIIDNSVLRRSNIYI